MNESTRPSASTAPLLDESKHPAHQVMLECLDQALQEIKRRIINGECIEEDADFGFSKTRMLVLKKYKTGADFYDITTSFGIEVKIVRPTKSGADP